MQTYLFYSALILSAVPNFGEAVQPLSIVGALAFFLYYFMKELKEVRTHMESSRKQYEDKIEALSERVFKVEEHSRETLNRFTNALEDLSQTMRKFNDK